MHSPDLIKAQLSRRNHSGNTKAAQKSHPLRPCDGHLCARMDRKVRKISLYKRKNPVILHQDGIKAGLIKRCQIIIEFSLKFPVFNERIHRKVQSLSENMRLPDRSDQLIRVKITRVRPGAELPAAAVNRIGAGAHHRPEALIISRRCQKLNISVKPVQSIHPLSRLISGDHRSAFPVPLPCPLPRSFAPQHPAAAF